MHEAVGCLHQASRSHKASTALPVPTSDLLIRTACPVGMSATNTYIVKHSRQVDMMALQLPHNICSESGVLCWAKLQTQVSASRPSARGEAFGKACSQTGNQG